MFTTCPFMPPEPALTSTVSGDDSFFALILPFSPLPLSFCTYKDNKLSVL